MSAPTAAAPGRSSGFPGEPGLWLFILLDLTVFAVLFVVALVMRAEQPATFDAGAGQLHPALGLLNTLLLLTGSLAVAHGQRLLRRDHAAGTRRALGLGALCGLGFLAVKGVEWGLLLGDGLTPTSSDFLQLYFLLTGMHLVHVLIGLAGLVWARRRLARWPGEAGSVQATEGAASYWHVVDLLWLVLFPLLYLLGTT